VVKGLQRCVEVTVGCIIQSGDLANSTIDSMDEYPPNYMDDETQSADSLLGIAHPKLHPKDIIANIVVKNSAQDQEAYLLQNQYPVRDNMNVVLQEVPTSIHIELKDLRTNNSLVRRFEKTLGIVDIPGK
jgi:hypothetical protein